MKPTFSELYRTLVLALSLRPGFMVRHSESLSLYLGGGGGGVGSAVAGASVKTKAE